jgi:hypothetical protein
MACNITMGVRETACEDGKQTSAAQNRSQWQVLRISISVPLGSSNAACLSEQKFNEIQQKNCVSTLPRMGC